MSILSVKGAVDIDVVLSNGDIDSALDSLMG